MNKNLSILLSISMLALGSCSDDDNNKGSTTVKTAIGDLTLPAPYSTISAERYSTTIDRPLTNKPTAPTGFTVTKWADNLTNPRNTYIAPNGDVFVAESNTNNSANRITIFRDANADGTYEIRQPFAQNLNKPFGMLILGNFFYIANTDGLFRYPYTTGDLTIQGNGVKIVDLPAGGYNNHWTRNLLANTAGTKIYISVGSGSNNAEYGLANEVRRANILEINPDGSGERIYANGLRNPVGMDWNPAVPGELWAAINERDNLGDDLVPDYMTGVKDGGFYGWPFSYYGQILDPRMKGQGQDLVARAIVPDVPLGSHTASLGLTFYNKTAFPAIYRNGAFVGQRGSWNRSRMVGYKVVFVPFINGKPVGQPQDFLTGFIASESASTVYGRPVDVTVMNDGSLLVNDDAGNTIWRVAAN